MKKIGVTAAFVLGFVLTSWVTMAQSKVDQGKSGTEGGWQTRPHVCRSTSPHGRALITGDAGWVPASASQKPRAYIVVCNSKQNSSGSIKCRVDNTLPVYATGNAGDFLGNGDCIKYTTSNRVDGGSPVICISDSAAGLEVTSFECLF